MQCEGVRVSQHDRDQRQKQQDAGMHDMTHARLELGCAALYRICGCALLCLCHCLHYGLLQFMLMGAQTGLVVWRKQHKRSYDLVSSSRARS
jgi:hypothetical protein